MRRATFKAFPQRCAALWVLAMAALAVSATNAGAVPSFAAQTGMPCQSCHVGGFGPQLTPFGREFKLQGYTLRTNDKSVPLSIMEVASYLHTAQAQTPPPPSFSSNDNFNLDQLSLFSPAASASISGRSSRALTTASPRCGTGTISTCAPRPRSRSTRLT